MVRKEIVVLEDDLDGSKADETVKFGFGDMLYEIDLSRAHADELRASLAEFVKHARRTGTGRVQSSARPATRATGPARIDAQQSKAIRVWARRKGYTVSDVGRVPQRIVDEFMAEAGRG